MTTIAVAAVDVQALSDDLISCRQRGLEYIDLDTERQPYKQLPTLESVAAAYIAQLSSSESSRLDKIERLLRDALDAFAGSGEQRKATFLTALFFDQPDSLGPPTAQKRLEAAMDYHKNTRPVGEERASFDRLRQPYFRQFARFLIDFVGSAGHQPEAPTMTPSGSWRTSPVPWLAAATLVAIVIMLVSAIVLTVRRQHSSTRDTPGSTKLTASPTSSSNAYQVGKTYTEISGNRKGTRVFDDPALLQRENTPIAFMQPVGVSCRKFVPSMPSVSWWYRLASPPYNNQWWSPAVTFLNGDKPEGPYEHDVDEQVPICP